MFRAKIVPEPPGKEYGCCFRKTWPTRLQGTISKRPPHCQVRNDISVWMRKRKKNTVTSWKKKTSTDLYSALTEILTTPNIHLEVIWTKFMEVLAVNDKESSGNHWGSNTYTHYYFVFNCAFTLAICYRIGTVGSFFLRAFSSAGSNSHLNTRFQSKPPRSSVEAAIYWKLSIAITSITGQTILVRSYGRY